MSTKVSKEQIRGLITGLQITDVNKVEVELSGPSPAFRCSSCDEPFFWSDERWICAVCEYEFGVLNGLEVLQYQIDRMEAVQVALAELLPEEHVEKLEQIEGPKRSGFLSRFFKSSREASSE